MIGIRTREHKKHTKNRRIIPVLFAAGFLISMGVSLFAPFLMGRARAADQYTNFNVAFDSGGISTATCQAYFQTVRKTGALLNAQLSPQASSWIGQNLTARSLATKLGIKADADSNGEAARAPMAYIGISQIYYALNGADTSDIKVIKFKPADGPTESAADPQSQVPLPDTKGICDKMMMIPVSNTEWRGWQFDIPGASQGTAGSIAYARFVLGTGSSIPARGHLQYYNDGGKSAEDGGFAYAQDVDITIEGAPDNNGAPGTVITGVENANWVNAAKIQGSSGLFNGEIYQKGAWDEANGWSIYFLSALGTNSPAEREALINAASCEKPITVDGKVGQTCADAGGGSNCKPFIAVKATIDLTLKKSNGDSLGDATIGTMQNKINRLGNGTAIMYDYDNTTCKIVGIYNINLAAAGNADIWFYYSAQSKALMPVFSSGKANESPYIGQYNNAGQNVFAGGKTGCEGAVTASSIPADGTFSVLWRLTDPAFPCANPIYFNGNLAVRAQGGAAGEAGFTQGQTDLANNPQNLQLSQPEIVCNILSGVINWLVCPIITAAQAAVGKLDDAINSQLTIDTSKIFGDADPTSKAYHQAWASFRIFALALIVIAGLVMVIAQAAGVEILDAYTIKKIMPRLLVAAIFITLSWQLLRFGVELSNDLGNGIRSIIYTPFTSITNNAAQNGQLGGGSGFVLALIGTGGALAFGPIGLLTFVVTGLLAALIAFGLIVFRTVLIIFLAMMAPFAIACYILPNTQKVWNLWKDSIFGALLVFLFISAFIAIGRVFSVTFFNAGGTVGQLIGLIAYFAPYFLIPLAFRLAGGAVATIGGIVNDRSKGAFDRLKGVRQRQVQQRGQRWRQGALFNPDSKLTRFLGGNAVNTLGNYVGGASQPGGFTRMFGATGRVARANNSFATMEDYAKQDRNFAAQMDNEDAMIAHAMQNNANRLRQLEWFHKKDAYGKVIVDADGNAQVDEEKVSNAIAASRSIQMTGQSITAAGDAVARSGKVIANNEEAEQLYGAVARGNRSLQNAVTGRYRWVSRNSGRNDIGRGTAFEALQEMSLGEMSKLKPLGVDSFLNEVADMAATGKTWVKRDEAGNITDSGRDIDAREMQHLVDLLYSAQHNPYTNTYQQAAVQSTWDKIPDAMREVAERNYRAKLGGGGGGPEPDAGSMPPIAPRGGPRRSTRRTPAPTAPSPPPPPPPPTP